LVTDHGKWTVLPTMTVAQLLGVLLHALDQEPFS
jgi:hypothetical protein